MNRAFFAFIITITFAGFTPLRAQDAVKGETVFKKCIVCHAVGENARNKLGPQLNGLFGRKAGSIENFSYSPANKNSGLIWSEDNFMTYIKNPQGAIPGTKMVFAGLSDEQDIRDLIAYLKKFDASGKMN
ncbi:MAG: cytochrome c family protein [Pseudomonadota bacterium]